MCSRGSPNLQTRTVYKAVGY